MCKLKSSQMFIPLPCSTTSADLLLEPFQLLAFSNFTVSPERREPVCKCCLPPVIHLSSFEVDVMCVKVDLHYFKCPTFPKASLPGDRLSGILAEGRETGGLQCASILSSPTVGLNVKGSPETFVVTKPIL